MDSDKVLVMSEGRVAEYDSPDVLLKNEVSSLLSLIRWLLTSRLRYSKLWLMRLVWVLSSKVR